MDYSIEEVVMPSGGKEKLKKFAHKDVLECLANLTKRGFFSVDKTAETVETGPDGKLKRHVKLELFMKTGLVSESTLRSNSSILATLHVKFANQLQLRHRYKLPRYYAEIANHYRAGHKNGKALKFLMLAADDAIHMYAPQEALKLYGTYLKIGGKIKATQLRKEEMQEARKKNSGKGCMSTGAVVAAAQRESDTINSGSEDFGVSTNSSTAEIADAVVRGDDKDHVSVYGKAHEYGHIHRMMGEAYYYIGDLENSQKHLEIAVSFFGAAPGSSFFRGTVRRSNWAMRMYILAKGLKIKLKGGVGALSLQRGSELSGAGRVLASERCQTWFKLTQIHYVKGDTVAYAYAAMQNLASSEYLGRSSELSNAISQFIPICSSVGYNLLAERFCRESVQMSESLDDQEASAYSIVGRAVYLSGSGQLVAALDMLTISSQIFEASGNVQAWWECLAMIYVNNAALGVFEEGLKVADKGIEASMKVDNYTMINWFLEAKITSLICLGRTREAYEVINDGTITFVAEHPFPGSGDGSASPGGQSGKKPSRGRAPARSKGSTRRQSGRSSKVPRKGNRSTEEDLFLPELARSYAMEGKFDKAVEHALDYCNGPTTSWWHYNTFSCCAEVFTMSYLSSRMSGATIANKGHKELLRLAKESIGKLRIMARNFEAVRPEYFLAQGRYLCARSKGESGKKILAQAVYVSDNYTLLPVKARTCLEIARAATLKA